MKDPVLLWLNGGPGSSSLIGFFIEHGPFRASKDGKTLSINPYSWNRIANIIYVESPAFVGFSKSDNEGDRKVGDDITSADNFKFIQEWFKLYPEFRQNDFYVTGESYGGHYIPQLAQRILHEDYNHEINMKGFMLGNPALNADFYELGTADQRVDAWNFVTFMYSHGYIPHDLYGDCVQACEWGDYMKQCNKDYTRPSAACQAATTAALRHIPDNIDIYNVDAFACLDSDDLFYTKRFSLGAKIISEKRAQKKSVRGHEDYDPCIFQYMTKYLNMQDVQNAIHAEPCKWSSQGAIDYSDDDVHRNTIPVLQELVTNTTSRAWRKVVYSGDFDAACPFPGTQKAIYCLNLPVKKEYHQWDVDGQFAGTMTNYDGIDYATVHGTGHAIPWYTPKLAYEFYSLWITGKDF